MLLYSNPLCVQRTSTSSSSQKILVKIAFTLPFSLDFHPVKILRLILANTKELYKNYLRLVEILRLAEILAFL